MQIKPLALLRKVLTNERKIFLGGMPVVSADIPSEHRAGIPTSAIYGQPRRYQIRFPDGDVYDRHMSSGRPSATFRTVVELKRRRTLAIEVPSLVPGKRSGLENEVETLAYFQDLGCTIMEDYLYASDLTTIFDEVAFRPPQDAEATLDDVARMIRADACREVPLRDDVVIAVVDTGIDGRHPLCQVQVRQLSFSNY